MSTEAVEVEESTEGNWYKMEAFFDGEAKIISKTADADIVIQGWVPPSNDVAVCVVPPSVTSEQGIALQKLLTAELSSPVLVLTNNTQLVKLKQISDKAAEAIIKSQDSAEVLQFEKAD